MIPPGGRALRERPVRTMNVIVLDELTQDQPQVPLGIWCEVLDLPEGE
jgi:hypothetical protein